MIAAIWYRLRHLSRLFVWVVLVPTGLSILYFGIIASPVYISEAKFVVYNPSERLSSSGGLASLISGLGGNFSASASQTISSYIRSWDAMMALNHAVNLRYQYTHGVDFLDRYGGVFHPFINNVRLWRYYQSMTDDTLDPSSGISTLKVRAYNPAMAQKMNAFLLAKGQDIVNQLNAGAHEEAVRFAEADVQKARENLRQSTVDLADFRNGQRVISPLPQSQLQLALISKLQDQLIQEKTQLQAIEQHAPQNPSIPVLRSGVHALEGQIAVAKAQITGDHQSLASKDTEYETLQVNQDIAKKLLVAAVTALQQARITAQKQELFLETISKPNLPDAPQLPRRIEGVLATLVISLMIWGVLVVVIGGIKEHHER